MRFRLCAVLTLISLLMSGCVNFKKPPAVTETDSDRAIEGALHDVAINLDDPATGKPIWRLNFKRAEALIEGSDKSFIGFEGFHGVLYQKGLPALEIKADKCHGEFASMKLIIEGNIEGVSKINGLTLKAQKLVWLGSKDIFTAEGNPLIVSKDDLVELRDQKITADTSLNILRSGE